MLLAGLDLIKDRITDRYLLQSLVSVAIAKIDDQEFWVGMLAQLDDKKFEFDNDLMMMTNFLYVVSEAKNHATEEQLARFKEAI